MGGSKDISRSQDEQETHKNAHNGKYLHAHIRWVILPSQDGTHDRQASKSAC